MAIERIEVINELCAGSGLSGSALEDLRARLQQLSKEELQAELVKSLCGDNQNNWLMGLQLETSQSSVILSNHDKSTFIDPQGREITEFKDGDQVLERIIKSTDSNGNVFETLITFSSGKPLSLVKSKNGNKIESTTFTYFDETQDHGQFVTLETNKSDNSKVITNVLEVDQEGNTNPEDFIDRQTISLDGTKTYVYTENNCVVEAKTKPDGK